MERTELNQLADELDTYFREKEIYPKYIECDNAPVCPDIFIVIEYEIRGDWKHEHLYSEYLIKEFIDKKNWCIVGTDGDITEETGSDWYGATHIYKVGINKEIALGIKAVFG